MNLPGCGRTLRKARNALFLLGAIGIASCSHGSIPPTSGNTAGTPALQDFSTPHVPAATDALLSNGGKLQSFSQARGLILKSDADYGRFVDSAIQGAQRMQAISFLKLMPPGMRGDFVSINKDGSVTSNRAEFPHLVEFRRGARPVAQDTRPAPMAYPPTGGSGGPYLRNYSMQGINAAYGYATPPCDVQLQPGESGNMYFNSYSATSSGSITDAGIGANETSRFSSSSVVPFVNAAGEGWDPGNWVNESQGWSCGTTLGIMYGTLPSPNQGTSVLAVGVPDYDPSQFQLPPASANWYQSAWTFFPTPSGLLQGAGTWNGIASNCMGCSVARMFTIGQNSLDGACYGACDLNPPDGRWDQVVMGELIDPCQQQSSTQMTCTIEFLSSGAWQAGENDSGAGIFYDDPNNNQGLEGIVDATDSSESLRSKASNAALKQNLPAAPPAPCTPDSMGYCYVAGPIASCHGRWVGPMSDRTWIVSSIPGKYQVFKKVNSLELQGTYTATIDVSGDSCPPPGTAMSWSPGDPKSIYHDPNLP